MKMKDIPWTPIILIGGGIAAYYFLKDKLANLIPSLADLPKAFGLPGGEEVFDIVTQQLPVDMLPIITEEVPARVFDVLGIDQPSLLGGDETAEIVTQLVPDIMLETITQTVPSVVIDFLTGQTPTPPPKPIEDLSPQEQELVELTLGVPIIGMAPSELPVHDSRTLLLERLGLLPDNPDFARLAPIPVAPTPPPAAEPIPIEVRQAEIIASLPPPPPPPPAPVYVAPPPEAPPPPVSEVVAPYIAPNIIRLIGGF